MNWSKLISFLLAALFLGSLFFGLLRSHFIEFQQTVSNGSTLCLSCIGVK